MRWSSCSSRWSSRRSRPESSARRARASSSASRCIRSFSSLASRISSFWRARASASMRRASAVAAFIDCDAQRLRKSTPTAMPPTAASTATARRGRGSIFSSSRPADCGPDARDAVVGSFARGRESSRRVVPPWAAIEPKLWSAPLTRRVVYLVRSVRRPSLRVNRLLTGHGAAMRRTCGPTCGGRFPRPPGRAEAPDAARVAPGAGGSWLTTARRAGPRDDPRSRSRLRPCRSPAPRR